MYALVVNTKLGQEYVRCGFDRVIQLPVWSKSVETRTRIGPLRSDRLIKHPIW